MHMIPTLSADDAARAIDASVAAAGAAGVAVTVAVVDAAGMLLALRRMDGARGFSVDLATRKARTAAAVGVGTGVLDTMLKGRPMASAEMITLPGGVPVPSEGRSAGAVGVSGAAADVDEKIAQAGVEALL